EPQRLAEPDRRAAADGDDRIGAALDEPRGRGLDDLRRNVDARAIEHLRREPLERGHDLVDEAPARLRDDEHALRAELGEAAREVAEAIALEDGLRNHRDRRYSARPAREILASMSITRDPERLSRVAGQLGHAIREAQAGSRIRLPVIQPGDA